jgi:hypothetical protein
MFTSRPLTSPRVFTVTVSVLLIALLTVSALLAAWGSQQGPKLQAVSFDVNRAVTFDGSRLVIVSTQLLKNGAADVLVKPQMDATAAVSGKKVTIVFSDALRNETDYTVSVSVTASETGRTSQLTYNVRTPSASVFTLRSVDGGTDSVLSHDLGTGEAVPVYEHSGIGRFAPIDGGLVVALDAAEGLSTLKTISLPDGHEKDVNMPLPGAITSLAAPGGSAVFGYTMPAYDFISQILSQNLFIQDARSPDIAPTKITDVNGAPVAIRAWTWAPGSKSILYQDARSDVWLTGTAALDPPQLIGHYNEIQGFIGSSPVAVVDNLAAPFAVDLLKGKTVKLTLAEPRLQAQERPVDFQLVNSNGLYLLSIVSDIITDTGAVGSQSSIIAVDGEKERDVIKSSVSGETLTNLCLSPNRQYLALQVELPDDGTSKDALNPHMSTSTRIVDIETGQVMPDIEGARGSWCQTQTRQPLKQ